MLPLPRDRSRAIPLPWGIPHTPSQLVRAAFLAAISILAALTHAQSCDPAWLSAGQENGLPGTDMAVRTTAVFDVDGEGPEPAWLIIGGQGTSSSSTAGNTVIRGLAAWNGSNWINIGNAETPVGGGTVEALHIHNGELIASGTFASIAGVPANNIAAWNGTTWRPLASGLGVGNSQVRALATYNNELYAGGTFVATGAGALVYNIARFDGSAWRSVANGVAEATNTSSSVNALLNFGGDLVVAGDFSNAGDIPARNIARWNGSTFSGFAQGIGRDTFSSVNVLAVINGTLFAGGIIDALPGGSTNTFSGLAQWSGTQWTRSANNYTFGEVRSIRTFQDSIYIATASVDQNQLVRWTGSSTPPVPVLPAPAAGFPQLYHLDSYAGQLVIAGSLSADAAAFYRGMGVVNFNGTSFNSFGRGFAGSITALQPDGDGVFMAGSIQFAGNAPATRGLVRWNGASTWETYPGSIFNSGAINDVTRFGNQIIVGGSFFTSTSGINHLSAWNGTAWTRVGASSPSNDVRAVAVFQNELYIGGNFQTIGTVPSPFIARWNGTAWNLVGHGLNGLVTDLHVFGDRLIATGTFSASGTTQLSRIGAWNGSEWQPLGTGLGPSAEGRCLATWGNNLIVAGANFAFQLTPVSRWNGSTWTSMPAAPTSVSRLEVIGGILYAVGSFSSVNLVSCAGFAQWNGSIWVVPSLGLPGTFLASSASSPVTPTAVARLSDGRGIVCGPFAFAGGSVARSWATFSAGGGQNPILSQPADFTACPNLGAQFSVTLQNPAAASYEWRRDGMPLRDGRGISGATSNILTIEGVLPTDAGLYQCRIITTCGVLNSAEATLTVAVQPNCPKVCDDVDFNNDGSIFDPLDVDSFLSVFSEGPCL